MQAERDLMKRWLQWLQCQHHTITTTTTTTTITILSDPGIDTSHHLMSARELTLLRSRKT
jgi:hypothetical protein